MEIQTPMDEQTPHSWNRFVQALQRHGIMELERKDTSILQINVGKLCNQACKHCHVEAGPKRTEVMEDTIVRRMIQLAGEEQIESVDITGGAPEMNPDFRSLVEGIAALGKALIVRCNLTIILEPGFDWLPGFYAAHGVHLVSSMPCYTPENVDQQRGKGVFEKSIAALRILNQIGYGRGEAAEGLQLDLVFNPLGATLPGDQAGLEADYKRVLQEKFGISFNRLSTLANLPIGRFAQTLRRSGEYLPYLQLLENSFNPETLPSLMCRNTLSVGWDGRIYDCDFNQMLDMEIGGSRAGSNGGGSVNLFDPEFSLENLRSRPILTGEHCLGCTAGAGSSCGGALT